MKALIDKFFELTKGEEGATATEYAVMLVMILLVSLATIVFLGVKVEEGFNKISMLIENATTD